MEGNQTRAQNADVSLTESTHAVGNPLHDGNTSKQNIRMDEVSSEASNITPQSRNQSGAVRVGDVTAHADGISGASTNQSKEVRCLSIRDVSAHLGDDTERPVIKTSSSPEHSRDKEKDQLYLASFSSSCDSNWRLLNSSCDSTQSNSNTASSDTTKKLPVLKPRSPPISQISSTGSRRLSNKRKSRSISSLDLSVPKDLSKMTKDETKETEDNRSAASSERSSRHENFELGDMPSADQPDIGKNSSNGYDLVEDPWVRAPSVSNTSKVRFATARLSTSERSGGVGQQISSTPILPERQSSDEGEIYSGLPQSRTESQEELDRISQQRRNTNSPEPCHEQQQANQNHDRIRNDLDLLSRPSWCDAKFALSRVQQGKAEGNQYALKLRAFIHRILFKLGCFIQRNAFTVLFVGLILLTACCIGLKQAHLETDIEKLWVETNGQLQAELDYGRRQSQSEGQTSESTYNAQLLMQTGSGAATVEALKYHLKAAMAATEVSVYMYNQTWSFEDVCYKHSLATTEEGSIFATILDKLLPCLIIGPLDCFWEGSKILGPKVPLKTIDGIPDITWKTLNPLEFVDLMIDTTGGLSSFTKELRSYRDLMVQGGITTGYVDRWCLDPNDPECPETAPNFHSKEPPNVVEILNKSCTGFATKLMRWPLDLIVGGIERNASGHLTSAQGLQTLFNLMGIGNMFQFHDNSFKTRDIDWTKETAKNVLYTWQRKYVKKIYELQQPENATDEQTLNAFSIATAEDILAKFSNIPLIRVLGGYLLMMGYACLSLMRTRASRSQGAVGLIGVVLVTLSVAAGLGICTVIGISFNAASTQVLPFLMLGLGVDDMFLMAHHFGEIAVLSYIPFQERVGECLKRVGVSVVLTSIAILSGFLFSLIIPMPALRAFGYQASIVTIFNLVSVLVIFPSILSLDLNRRKNNRLDILFCFESSTTNEVIDLSEENNQQRAVNNHGCNQCHRHNGPLPVDNNHCGTTITMHHTIQAYSNESYVTVLGPAAAGTTFHDASGPGRRPGDMDPTYDLTRTRSPPPQYTPKDQSPPQRPKVAFMDSNGGPPTAERTYDRPIRSTITPASSVRTLRTNGSNPPTNLTTPMESVRSSTHSLVPKRRRSSSFLCCPRNSKRCGSLYAKLAVLPSLTLNQLGERYYAPFLMRKPSRIFVLALFGALLGASIYGCTQVKDGLDLGDVLPRGTREHQAIVAQTTYFSFYPMYIITKEFDYARQQRNMYRIHEQVGNISYVMKQPDGTVMKFWLHYFREYLEGLQASFDADWQVGKVNASTWSSDVSDKTILAFKLLVQTGRVEDPTDTARIGCTPIGSKCSRPNRVRLVSDDGIINEDAFYNYLSVWFTDDPLAYAAAQASIYPTPKTFQSSRYDLNMIIPPSSGLTYSQIPFYLNGMRENEDFVNVIRSVRHICETMAANTELDTYPSGYPFTFWQQYIDLRFWLFVSLGAVIGAVFLVLSLVLFNPWAAGIMALFLAMIAAELLGFMGWAGVKLSAVPAVILVAAIGLGVEFTVHITFAYITSCGTREERVARSIGHMLGPVVDGSISTLLGVVMLAGSEFDFIITYFFQVLAFLILLGVLNGLILLPVVLSLIGPPAEIIPVGGGARLKTPTPPPSPPGELACNCRQCSCQQNHSANTNHNNNNRCQCMRCSQHRGRGGRYGQPTSRDDLQVHRRYQTRHDAHVYSQPATENYAGRWRYPDAHYDSRVDNARFVRTDDVPGRSQQYHPHSIPPINEEETSQVYMRPDYVMYSNGRKPPHTQDIHCENLQTRSDFHPIPPAAEVPRNNGPNVRQRGAGDRRQHIATLSSSLTVNLHTSGRPKVVSFVEPGGPPPDVIHPNYVWQKANYDDTPAPLEHGRMPNRHFDISALNGVSGNIGGT
uniref:Protein patched homolog 1 n=1 Tax=Phallusia mammillata TaxID=59560 RepID=A0A6F9DQ57_9ASCI|nr:protein patched homolog 1 [Phallusia mammillata]